MNITAIIQGIKYQPFIKSNLRTFDINTFDINSALGTCVVRDGMNEFALSKWVSPKRTRSYPYARVYDTISRIKRVTIIPIVKDEGLDGDRDFIQWDTICLMSLLEVYVIFGYYSQAVRNTKWANKITNQRFENQVISSKLREFSSYQSSALHWNLKELRESLPGVVDLQKNAYLTIERKTGVKLKSFAGIDKFKEQLQHDMQLFMASSRKKAEQAQARELRTLHIQENLATQTKAGITVTNYVGGKYFFTVDEVSLQGEEVNLIESKHSGRAILPSKNDIKDGLLKMILYSNFSEVSVNNVKVPHKATLKLTSKYIQGSITSDLPEIEVSYFFNINKISSTDRVFINQLLNEARYNNFTIQICAAT